MAAPHYQSPLPDLRRVSRREPCPICGAVKFCELRADGAVHCMKVESAKLCNGRGGGWWHNLPGRDASAPIHAVPPTPKPEPPRADPATLDAVYSAWLAACPLSATDRANLETRPVLAAAMSNYGTLPARAAQGSILAALESRFGRPTLLTVPGIIEEDGALRFSLSGGMLLAVRGLDGRIKGFTTRQVDKAGKKSYVWLSSAGHGGPGSGSPAHVVQPLGAPAHTVLVTEGHIKAEIAAERLGLITIGLIGHTAQADGLAVLKQLADRGALCVIIAFDEDAKPETRALVDASRRRFAAAAFALGLAVRYARWDHTLGKGVDDLLVNGHQPTIKIVPAVLVPTDDEGDQSVGDSPGLSAKGEALSLLQKKAARYDHLEGVINARITLREQATNPEAPKRAATSSQKLTLMVGWEEAGYPNEIGSADAPPEPSKVYVSAIAARTGTSRQTVTSDLKSLAAGGFITHQVIPAASRGEYPVVKIAPVRGLRLNEPIPLPERTKKAREQAAEKRRQCKDCGNSNVSVELVQMEKVTCHHCGVVNIEEPGEAAKRAVPLKFSPKHHYEKQEQQRRDEEWRITQEELKAMQPVKEFNGEPEEEAPEPAAGPSPVKEFNNRSTVGVIHSEHTASVSPVKEFNGEPTPEPAPIGAPRTDPRPLSPPDCGCHRPVWTRAGSKYWYCDTCYVGYVVDDPPDRVAS